MTHFSRAPPGEGAPGTASLPEPCASRAVLIVDSPTAVCARLECPGPGANLHDERVSLQAKAFPRRPAGQGPDPPARAPSRRCGALHFGAAGATVSPVDGRGAAGRGVRIPALAVVVALALLTAFVYART